MCTVGVVGGQWTFDVIEVSVCLVGAVGVSVCSVVMGSVCGPFLCGGGHLWSFNVMMGQCVLSWCGGGSVSA